MASNFWTGTWTHTFQTFHMLLPANHQHQPVSKLVKFWMATSSLFIKEKKYSSNAKVLKESREHWTTILEHTMIPSSYQVIQSTSNGHMKNDREALWHDKKDNTTLKLHLNFHSDSNQFTANPNPPPIPHHATQLPKTYQSHQFQDP